MAIFYPFFRVRDAESSANLIKQVWYNAIYEKRDDKTDKYTRPKGYFVSDFNYTFLHYAMPILMQKY